MHLGFDLRVEKPPTGLAEELYGCVAVRAQFTSIKFCCSFVWAEKLWVTMSDWGLTGEAFDSFLIWLDADRDQAGVKYETIRRRLVLFFNCRGCAAPESLADETINRVIRRVPSFHESYTGDPVRYFYGVAHYVHLEYLNDTKKDAGPLIELLSRLPQPEMDSEREQVYRSLERCLQKQPPAKREMFVSYHLVDKKTKVDDHQMLADRLGMTLNALRLQVHRLKNELRACITACLAKAEAE